MYLRLPPELADKASLFIHRWSRLLGFKVAVVKIVSSLACLLGGGFIGREEPTIQIGDSLFAIVHRRFGGTRCSY